MSGKAGRMQMNSLHSGREFSIQHPVVSNHLSEVSAAGVSKGTPSGCKSFFQAWQLSGFDARADY
jgi:hypothetical protein